MLEIKKNAKPLLAFLAFHQFYSIAIRMLCIFFNKFCNNNNAKISGNSAIPTLTSYDLKKFKQKTF